MALSLASLKRAGDNVSPPIMLWYGNNGIGKTNMAGSIPDTVAIQLEQGIRNKRLADLPTFGLLDSYEKVCEAISVLLNEAHEFKHVFFDTLDWLEPLIWSHTCKLNNWTSIEDAGYGKGYEVALDVWREFLDGLNVLRNERRMAISLLAHHKVTRYNAPDSEPYDRYDIKLHESAKGRGALPLLKEAVDYIFFMNYRASIVKDGTDAQKKRGDGRARGVGAGLRMVYTEERPAHVAKNRDDMPDSIQLPDDPAAAWPAVAQHIPWFSAATA